MTTTLSGTDMLYDATLLGWAEGIATRISDERGDLVQSTYEEGCGEYQDLVKVLRGALGEDWENALKSLDEEALYDSINNYLNANLDKIEPLVGTLVIETDYFDEDE